MLLNPIFDNIAVMNTQIIENQINFFPGIFDQAITEFYEYLRVHSFIVKHEPYFPLVGNRGDQADTLTPGIAADNRGLSFRTIAASLMIGVAKTRFNSPIDFGLFLFSHLNNGRIFVFKPLLNSFRVLFIGPAKGFLRGKSPSTKVLSDCLDGHVD